MSDKKSGADKPSAYQEFIAEHPWPVGETRQNLPSVRWDFGMSRDPFIAKQMKDIGKTETERREEAIGRQSRMISKDRPQHNLHPPKSMAAGVDRRKFAREWLREHRDAAMEQARQFELARRELSNPTPRQKTSKGPER